MLNNMLSPYRVLDLTDEKGLFCGKILADLGADVIVVEKPNGNPARRLGPFYHDIPSPEESLYWFAYGNNKRGITLDITTADGKEIFKQLVKTADIVVESFAPGYLKKLGLGYEVLSKFNPGLILTSITPYGQGGPYVNNEESDLTLMSLGGLVQVSGEPGQQPLRISFPQAYLWGGAYAAVGSLIALYWQEVGGGEGQTIDVSIHEACTWSTTDTNMFWIMLKALQKRQGMWRWRGPTLKIKQVFRCKNGWVSYWIFGGPRGGKGRRLLVEWMDREGMCPDWLREFDFDSWDFMKTTEEFSERLSQTIERFFMTKTKEELFAAGIGMGLFLAPVNTIAEAFNSLHLKDRKFWVEVEHPELATKIPYPGPMIQSSEQLVQLRTRAPLIGEHNREIYEELGLSAKELVMLKGIGVI